MTVALAVVSLIAAAMFALAAGAPKVFGVGRVGGNWRHYGVPHVAWRAIGVLEIAGAVGLAAGVFADARCGLASAAGLCALMVGALATHVRAKEGAKETAPAVVALALCVVVVAGRAHEIGLV